MKITTIKARTLGATENKRSIFSPPDEAMLGGTGAFRQGSQTQPEPAALTVVEIGTDEGLVGVGTCGGFNLAAESIIHKHFTQHLLGQDPRRVEWIWDKLYMETQQYGLRGAVVMAMSGVDIALWDLLGKIAEQPVYNLIGGKTKERVPLYMSLLRNSDGVEGTVRRAIQDAEAGFKAMKYFFSYGPRHGLEGMRKEIEIISEIRSAIGPDVQFMVDAHMLWELPYALRMIDKIADADLNIEWLEEPVPPDDMAAHERICATSPIPIAAGEHARTRFEYLDFINAGVFYLQPDINRVGGFTEVLRICGLAAAHSRAVCPHQGWLHSYHLVTAKNVCPVGEYFPRREPLTGNSLIWDALNGEPEPDANGTIEVSDSPGFGWTVNEAGVKKHLISAD